MFRIFCAATIWILSSIAIEPRGMCKFINWAGNIVNRSLRVSPTVRLRLNGVADKIRARQTVQPWSVDCPREDRNWDRGKIYFVNDAIYYNLQKKSLEIFLGRDIKGFSQIWKIQLIRLINYLYFRSFSVLLFRWFISSSVIFIQTFNNSFNKFYYSLHNK